MIERADIKQTIDQIGDLELAHHYDSFVIFAAIKTLETCGNEIAELQAKLAEAEKDAATMRTKAIAMERVTPIAINKLRNWPATYAMQPTNEQFIAMAMSEVDAAMKEQP